MTSYKTIAQNFADATKALETTASELHAMETELQAVIAERDALRAENAQLKARLSAGLQIGGAIAVGTR